MKAIELVVRAVKRFGTSLESFMNSKMPTQIQKKAVISRLLDFEPKKIDFLFEKDVDDRLRERSEILIEESWEFNQEDRVLIRSAIDIWSQTGLVFLSEIMNLSEPNLNRLLKAIQQARIEGVTQYEESNMEQADKKNQVRRRKDEGI